MAVELAAEQSYGQVNFNEVVARSQATTLDGMGKMFALTGDRQSSIFLKHVDEIEGLEAAANRQVMYREAPIERSKE